MYEDLVSSASRLDGGDDELALAVCDPTTQYVLPPIPADIFVDSLCGLVRFVVVVVYRRRKLVVRIMVFRS